MGILASDGICLDYLIIDVVVETLSTHASPPDGVAEGRRYHRGREIICRFQTSLLEMQYNSIC